MKYGYVTVAAAIPAVKVGDTDYNAEQISALIDSAESQNAEIIVFPELSITGYSCQDLFAQQTLIEQAEAAVESLLHSTCSADAICIVGAPIVIGTSLYNCAVVFQHGKILGIVPKTYLPNYNEFYERRWFASSCGLIDTEIRYAGSTVKVSKTPQLFRTEGGMMFGIEICEDLWSPVPCSNELALAGADIIFNLSASDELIGKHKYLKSLLLQQSARTLAGYVYCGCGFGESTQDVVYGGNAIICENGELVGEGKRFSFEPQVVVNQIDIERLRSERRKNTTFGMACIGKQASIVDCDKVAPREFVLRRMINPYPFIPNDKDMVSSCNEITSIQVAGLAKRLVHTGCKRVVVGISGGLDSTLALLICVMAFDKLHFDRKNIVGVTMPGFGTTDRTYHNAIALMQDLGVTVREINISKSVNQHFEDIGHDANQHDITYENSQARERTQILMDLSNKLGALVIGTGDLSELALGWATYNGDHMSMYGVNCGIPKTLIRYLVRNIAQNNMDEATKAVLLDIIDTPISPELIPADEQGKIVQKTEDLVGPYDLHDFFLYHFLRFGTRPAKLYLLARSAFAVEKFSNEMIKHWLTVFIRRFFAQQFKRSCLPDGPKVGSVSLSPRGDWRMPSDASAAIWLKECESL